MRVIELAQELSVDAEALVSLLRQMGVPVADKDATITAGQHDKVLARVERERRAGRADPAAAIHAALEDAAPAPTKRRRRRRKAEVVEVEAAPEEVDDSVEVEPSQGEAGDDLDAPVADAASEGEDVSSRDESADSPTGDVAADIDGSADAPDTVAADDVVSGAEDDAGSAADGDDASSVDDGPVVAADETPVDAGDASADDGGIASASSDAPTESHEASSDSPEAGEASVPESASAESAAGVAPPPAPKRNPLRSTAPRT